MRPQAPGRVLTPHARADRNPSAATRWKKPPAPRPPPPPNPIPPWNLPSVTPRARPFPSLYKEAPPCRASARYAAARKRSGTPAWSVRAAAVAAAEAVEGLLKDGGAAGRDEVHHVPGAEGTQYLRAAHQNDRIHDASAGGVPERQGEGVCARRVRTTERGVHPLSRGVPPAGPAVAGGKVLCPLLWVALARSPLLLRGLSGTQRPGNGSKALGVRQRLLHFPWHLTNFQPHSAASPGQN